MPQAKNQGERSINKSKKVPVPPKPADKPSISPPPAHSHRIVQSQGRLRSAHSFDHSMKDDLVRLFHTPDTLTGQERTTDYRVQLPGYWIRMVHSKRTDAVHPDIEPSSIQGPLGDCLGQ